MTARHHDDNCDSLRQAGAIPYRVVDDAVEILLITSRDTGRWVIPKGYVDDGLTPSDAAIKEGFEEAGVVGDLVGETPLGFVHYPKTLKDGSIQTACIEIFPVLVRKLRKKWPEKGQRILAWFPAEDAAKMVREPELAALFLQLQESHARE